ncbi:sec1 family domain-containing protein 2-like [Plakobranchus ocellatus]|uniref:Sec1 family domain-containing protein 2-like n=1 Tax=Plakobranchus ocellatus TaxID=259542 RepID=A0AAV4CKI7_9GAST|nr:sec1 family domain-containing protein 2-like [Plakobranchus ocellatus]
MFGIEVCPRLFIAPAFSSMFPLLPSDVKQVAYQHNSGHHSSHDARSLDHLSDLELSHLPVALQAEIQELSSGLHALLQSLDVREDIYSVGHTARLVATQLDSYPPARARRKATQARASLILLDRTLDLTPVLIHQSDTLLDRLTNTLEPLPGHRNDRLVDMSALTHVVKNPTPGTILPGSLAPTNVAQRPSHLTSLVFKKQKEAVMEVNRKLVEAASAEKLPLNLGGSRPGRVSSELLDTTLASFRGKYTIIKKHLDLLQVAMATSQSLRRLSQRADAALAAEKNLVQALSESLYGDGSLSALALLSRLVDKEMKASTTDRELNLDDLLCLLTFTFSLSAGDCGHPEEASDLRENLAKWILQESTELPPLTRQIVGEQVTESILTDQVESVWERLEGVGASREDLSQFRGIIGTLADELVSDRGVVGTLADELDSDRGIIGTLADELVSDSGIDELVSDRGIIGTLADELVSDRGVIGTLADELVSDSGIVGTLADELVSDRGVIGTLADELVSDRGIIGTLADELS